MTDEVHHVMSLGRPALPKSLLTDFTRLLEPVYPRKLWGMGHSRLAVITRGTDCALGAEQHT